MPDFFHKYVAELKYGNSTTYTLITINILVFIVVNLVSLVFGGVSQQQLATVFGGSAFPLVLYENQWWRLVVSTFLHIDWWHILLNMVALYSIGSFLESFYSSKKLFVVYVVTGIAGSALALLELNAITLGASGAIFGFVGLIVGNLMKKNTYSTGLPIRISSLYPALLWLVISFGISGVSFLGHLGGFVAGVLLGLFLQTANTFNTSNKRINILNISFRICVALVIISFLLLVLNIFFNI